MIWASGTSTVEVQNAMKFDPSKFRKGRRLGRDSYDMKTPIWPFGRGIQRYPVNSCRKKQVVHIFDVFFAVKPKPDQTIEQTAEMPWRSCNITAKWQRGHAIHTTFPPMWQVPDMIPIETSCGCWANDPCDCILIILIWRCWLGQRSDNVRAIPRLSDWLPS